ncbi:MAG: C10 family peptidase [Prevotella sp.]|nr:C10 family peptidase [Prevotella sp.]
MKKYNCCHLASRFVAMLALVILGTASSLATPISESEALQRAIAFMQQRGKTTDLPSNVRRAPTQGTGNTAEAYYVFNLQNEGGFVVVSGDDRTPAILGYADSGSFNADDIPDGLRYLLGQYADEKAWLDAHPEYTEQDVAASRAGAMRQPVAPLLQSRWDQGAPYNALCPMVTSELRGVTGCVATAMAQVMYYHKHPSQPTASIPGYNSMASLTKDFTFDWNNMVTTYANNDNGTSANAVAQLMLYCGTSLRMQYKKDSNGNPISEAYNVSVGEMLKAYYDYNTDYVQRQHYTYQQWVDLMYGEMVAGRPVVFGGQSAGGGHSFVCDGYDSGDYFHMNWGWGGSSDGYYRLSLLNPWEQGIGGSSTLDGFSYSQDAVIGIAKRNSPSAEPPQRLSLDALQFDKTGSTDTQTATRDNTGDAFPITLYYMVYSFLYDTNSFDVAVQMEDANGSLVGTLYNTSNTSLEFNRGDGTMFTGYTPANLDDGTYYIKVVGRQHGTTDWQECYDGEQLQIEAIVKENTLKLNAPIVSGSGNTLTLNSPLTVNNNNPKVGYDLEVIASVKGGATDYHGNLYLYVDDETEITKQRKMGKAVDIPAGKTVDVRFVYTPQKEGEFNISVRKGPSTIIGEQLPVTIAASNVTTDIVLGFAYDITNQDDNGQLYGNVFRATVTVTNPETDKSYIGHFVCSVREWTEPNNGNNSSEWTYNSISYTEYPLMVEGGGTVYVNVAGDGLIPGKFYSVRISYKNGKNSYAEVLHLGYDEVNKHGLLTVAENSYSLGDASGAITPYEIVDDIIAVGNACFADLRNIRSFENISITPSSNSNCLYMLAENTTVPTNLQGKNVVIGSTASNIVLVDEHPFYSPIAFTAQNISYTRTFTLAAAGGKNGGWNTIMLPFAPTSIKVDEAEKGWFTSDTDTDKHFWLRTFTGDDYGHVNFGYPTAMEAYVPYLIAVPGDTWGETWKLTDKEMVFSGTNASIVATKDVGTPASGDYFMFCGSTAGATANEAIYMLNDAGSKFVKKPAGTAVAPFRGWFEAISISSLGLASLSIGSAATDINLPQMNMLPQQQQVYDLQGRSVQGHMKPGIYIMGGKKVIIK